MEDIDHTDSEMVHDLGLCTYPPVNDINGINIIQEVNNANKIEYSCRKLPKVTINPSIAFYNVDELDGFYCEATDQLNELNKYELIARRYFLHAPLTLRIHCEGFGVSFRHVLANADIVTHAIKLLHEAYESTR